MQGVASCLSNTLEILFYFLASILLASSLFVVFARNPVVNVLSLILATFYAAGIFILLKAEYLAFSLIIIYVGAVAVLFLFVVMLISIEKPKKTELKSPLAFFGLLLIVELVTLLWHAKNPLILDEFSTFSIASFKNLTNAHALGELLYTYYFLAFQLSGLVLFVAMIGAIILVYEKRDTIKRQKVSDQLKRTKKNSLMIVKIQPTLKAEES